MPFGPELSPVSAIALPGQTLEQIPAILVGLIANIRCLESSYDLLRIARLRGDKAARAHQVRLTLDGLRQMRDAFAEKLQGHPLFPRHFVVDQPLPQAGVERLRALGVH